MEVALTLHESGRVAMKKYELEKAERRYNSSIAMKGRLFGKEKDHPGVAKTLHGQADCCMEKVKSMKHVGNTK